MKKVIQNLSEMSDSKEVYASRPNPFVAGFIYCIVLLVIAAVCYSFFGKIGVSARCTGIIRPNEEVSTVSGMIDGRVESMEHVDGDFVKKGDVILRIDTSQGKITLDDLRESKQRYEQEYRLTKKFLTGIQSGKNPFSSNRQSEEYPYYIKYRDFVLGLKSTKENVKYDEQKATATIESLTKQRETTKENINALNAYRKSVKENTNYMADYPQYESRYLSYRAAMEKLDEDYKTQRKQIEAGTSEESSRQLVSYYSEQTGLYSKLIRSVKNEKSLFTSGETLGTALYTDFENNLAEYRRSFETAKQTYDYYSGVMGESDGEKDEAEYNLALAKTKMDSAEAAIETFKDKTISEYEAILDDLEAKLSDAEVSHKGVRSKKELLEELSDGYEQSKKQQQYDALSQIDSSLEAAKIELQGLQADLTLNRITRNLYKNSKDEDGKPISVSSASVKQIDMLLDEADALEDQIKDVKYQIKTAKQQIKQGTILAARDGILNMPEELVNGDLLAAGDVVGTILPANESQLRVQLYVDNADIANIKPGDRIKYSVAALPSNRYGIVEGEVTTVSNDALSGNEGFAGYYLVEGSIGKDTPTDRNGNAASIEVGMQVTAKIVTQEKRILYYLLEKIDLF